MIGKVADYDVVKLSNAIIFILRYVVPGNWSIKSSMIETKKVLRRISKIMEKQ